MNAAICNKSKIHECKLHPSFYRKKKTIEAAVHYQVMRRDYIGTIPANLTCESFNKRQQWASVAMFGNMTDA